MLLLSAADVHDRADAEALARLEERPGLREAFEAERAEARPDRRTLYFEARGGWRWVDLCDACGTELGELEDKPSLVALCEDCDAEHASLDVVLDGDAAAELDAALRDDDADADGLLGLGPGLDDRNVGTSQSLHRAG
ncbi:hypothetical protein [Aquipuribacter sp. SD81]|uniref:hypothetical protein n=1 Tax=Aquipuribacter sp. SD81 TaxID=3127703 RepID=UPI00301A3550